MLERFTSEARQVLVATDRYARLAGERATESRYLLLAVLSTSSDVCERLGTAGVNVERLTRRLEDSLGPWTPFRAGSGRGRPAFAEETKQVLETSVREMVRLRDDIIDSRHLTLAMLATKSRAGRVLVRSCGDRDLLQRALEQRKEHLGSAVATASPEPSASEEDASSHGVMERFTQEAKGSLEVMRELAMGVGARQMNSRHLLLALMRRSIDVRERLCAVGVDVGRLEERIWHEVGTYSEELAASRRPYSSGQLPFGQDLRIALNAVGPEVERLGDHEIDSRHLVLGPLAEHTEGRVCLMAELPDAAVLQQAFAGRPDPEDSATGRS